MENFKANVRVTAKSFVDLPSMHLRVEHDDVIRDDIRHLCSK